MFKLVYITKIEVKWKIINLYNILQNLKSQQENSKITKKFMELNIFLLK